MAKLATTPSRRAPLGAFSKLRAKCEAYESEHYPMDPPDPIEAIKFRMEEESLTRKDSEEILGTRTRVSEGLSRKRGLSINMIRAAQRTHSQTDTICRRSTVSRRTSQVGSSRICRAPEALYGRSS